MDFRHALFQVGGEGGAFGGGGGNGGILTIFGVSRIPEGATVELNGKPGNAPGGGGGGAGSIIFQGRPATREDLENGLSVSSLLTANAATARELLNILDGAWSYYSAPTIPHSVSITVAFVVEFGEVPQETLFCINLTVSEPNGSAVVSIPVDVAAPLNDLAIRRAFYVRHVPFEVTSYGVWNISLASGSLLLAEYKIEFRNGDPIPI